MGRIKKPTQADKILAYMQENKNGITALQALDRCSCFDLAGRIRDLRERGIEINSEYVMVRNKAGEKCRVKRYWLAS
jgi:hypothetical protein